MKKLEPDYYVLSHSLSRLSLLNKMSQSIPIRSWEKLLIYQTKKSESQLLPSEFHPQTSPHGRSVQFKRSENNLESNPFE